jgi:hypothetical protein
MDGSADEDSANDSSANDSSANDSSANDSSADEDSADEDSADEDSAKGVPGPPFVFPQVVSRRVISVTPGEFAPMAGAPAELVSARHISDELPHGQAQLRRVFPAIMFGQNFTSLSRLVCHGALTDLAAHYRKLGNGYREAAGSGGVFHQAP